MRNMSFSMTAEALLHDRKTVTRRLGWKQLKTGDLVCAVLKGMGLRKGEKVERLAELEVVVANNEPLRWITQADVVKEGYPDLTREEFIYDFCKALRCNPTTLVRRIEFKVVLWLCPETMRVR